MEEIRVTSCPLNCWDVCGLKVTIQNGKATKVDGDETHPTCIYRSNRGWMHFWRWEL
jgi:hypothetical protein